LTSPPCREASLGPDRHPPAPGHGGSAGMITGSRISGVAAVLPSGRLSTAEVEQRLDTHRLAGWKVPVGMIERLTGVRYRHVAPAGENASDLAAAAAGKVLAGTG